MYTTLVNVSINENNPWEKELLNSLISRIDISWLSNGKIFVGILSGPITFCELSNKIKSAILGALHG